MSLQPFTLLNETDPYDYESPVECFKLKIIGLYCIVTMIAGIIFNSLLLWILIYFKEFRTSINSFMIALSAINLIGCFFEFPFVIISNLSCKWTFKKIGCMLSGFIMYFIGCTSIYLMAAISFERFYIIYKPMSIRTINKRFTTAAIIACACFGGFWSAMPIFGWSYYSLEGALTSCSVEWHEKSLNVISYNITIFAGVYFIPLILIFFSNFKLIFLIKKMPKLDGGSNPKNQLSKKIQLEKELTVTTILLIIGFVITWTPYAMVSLYSAFFATGKVSPLTGTIPSMFAKSSMVWSSVIYIFSNKQIKLKFKRIFQNVAKENATTSNSQSYPQPSSILQNDTAKSIATAE